jgi:hypothetical protein
MQVANWLDRLREISQQSPDCRVMIFDEPPDWTDAADYQPEELPVLQVTVDRDAGQVALHTEQDEDGSFLAPTPMLLSELVATLEGTADPIFEMFWVSGLRRLLESDEEIDDRQADAGPYYGRLAIPLVGVGHPDDLAHVAFIRERVAADSDADDV